MKHIESFLQQISSLSYFQLVILVCAVFLFFGGHYWIKKKFIKRTGSKYIDKLEDRSSWIFYPSQYNLTEKIITVGIYLLTFSLLVISVNV